MLYAGKFSICETVPIMCWSVSGRFNLIVTAESALQIAKSDRSLMCEPIICLPRCRVIIQIWQPGNICPDPVIDVSIEVSRVEYSLFAAVMSQIPILGFPPFRLRVADILLYKFALTAKDVFSKYLFAVPLTNGRA